jgi:hypothetical protein
LNYFQPAIAETQRDRTFHLLRFHDSSSDMLPIQRVARRLSLEGCDYSDLKISDDRIDECLKFLSYGNWPKPQPHLCKLGTAIDVLRKPGNEGQFTIVSSGPLGAPLGNPVSVSEPVNAPGLKTQTEDH